MNTDRSVSRTADKPSNSNALHWIAIATALATFPLIFMGGLVTSHQAGMSVPDWPNSYGYNMFLFPPRLWIQGIFYEHSHRLMGTLVGFLSIVLVLRAWGAGRSAKMRQWLAGLAGVSVLLAIAAGVAMAVGAAPAGKSRLESPIGHLLTGFAGLALILIAAWLSRQREERRWVRWLTVGVLISVIAQGVLGGLRVEMVNLDLAIVHACFAQAFFCLSVFVCVITSRWWRRVEEAGAPTVTTGRVVLLAIATVAVIYGQLIVGAVMRHYEAGLAIPDWPLHYGQILPPSDQPTLTELNTPWLRDPAIKPVTVAQVWLHFGHRTGALIVSVFVIALAVVLLKHHRASRLLSSLAWVLAVLLAGQFTLGVLTVLIRKPADLASLHVAVGALCLAVSFIIAIVSWRLRERAAVADERIPAPDFASPHTPSHLLTT
jgi:cytochrome c oxidase assembly protein subunit 15